MDSNDFENQFELLRQLARGVGVEHVILSVPQSLARGQLAVLMAEAVMPGGDAQ